MSSRNRKTSRKARQTDTHSNLRREVPNVIARWLRPAMVLVIAGAAFSLLIVKFYDGNLRPPTDTTVKQNIRKTPLTTITNQTLFNQVTTNKLDTEADEDRVVKLVNEGNIFLAQGKNAEAANRYEQAVLIDPGDESLHYNLAIALAKLGKTEEAKKQYAEALQIFPDHGDAHNNLGNLLMIEKKVSEGIEHFREAVRIMPDNASFHNNLGTALGLQGKAVEAIKEFAEAVKLKPDYAEARVNLANAYMAAGRVEETVAQLEEVLRSKPDFQPAIQTMRRVRQKQISSETQEKARN